MFVHIFYLYHPEYNKGGYFGFDTLIGYEYKSIFYGSFMWPVWSFSIGYLLRRFITEFVVHKRGIFLGNLLAFSCYKIGIFYTILNLFPKGKGFPNWGYYPIVVIISVCIGIMLVKLPSHSKVLELKKQIRVLKKQLFDLNAKVHYWKSKFRNLLDWNILTAREKYVLKEKDDEFIKEQIEILERK